MAKKLVKAIEIVGLLTIVGTAISKLAPLFKKADPKIKKKFSNIMELLIELKDEVAELSTMAVKEIKSKK